MRSLCWVELQGILLLDLMQLMWHDCQSHRGWAIIHAFVLSMSWIPYISGGGTLYNSNYTCMSLFTVGALSTVPMSAILISLTVIIFRLYDHGKQINGCLVGILYFLASGIALFNNMSLTWGCVVSLRLLYGLIHPSVLSLFSPTSAVMNNRKSNNTWYAGAFTESVINYHLDFLARFSMAMRRSGKGGWE